MKGHMMRPPILSSAKYCSKALRVCDFRDDRHARVTQSLPAKQTPDPKI